MIKSSDYSPEHISCPSYVSKAGAELFGVINEAGKVSYLKATIMVDNTFVEEAKTGRQAESRFRFSGKCITNGCLHWDAGTGTCVLIDKLIGIINQPVSQSLQACPIRQKCRWFLQEKELACANCSDVFRNGESEFFEMS